MIALLAVALAGIAIALVVVLRARGPRMAELKRSSVTPWWQVSLPRGEEIAPPRRRKRLALWRAVNPGTFTRRRKGGPW